MMKFIKSYLLQLILSIIACLSWLEASKIGNRSGDGTYLKGTPNLDFDQKIITGTDIIPADKPPITPKPKRK